MSELIEFRAGDLLFGPVVAFFSSFIAYIAVANSMTKFDTVAGRFRSNIVAQVTYDEIPILRFIAEGQPINQLAFSVHTTQPPVPAGSGKSIDTTRLVTYWCQQMLGHSYELAHPLMEKKFGKDRKNQWPSELQFAYHIRNGCFHGNTFDIQNNVISTTIPAIWRGKEIKYSDNGKSVIGDFIWSGDALVILHDLQNILA
jgi:hypothetical protein